MAKEEIKQTYHTPPPFDAYNKQLPIQQALGTARTQSRIEQATWQSANFIPGVQGYRFTPTTFEINTFNFGSGSILFTSLQSMTDGKLLGRSAGSSGSPQEISIGTGLSLSGGTLSSSVTQYTDELAQDAVGTIFADTNTIDLSYIDATPQIKADVRYQDTATIDLSDDASGLKADIIQAYRRKSLFDHFADVGNTHTDGTVDDLYSDTLAAGQLANNGEKIESEYGGIFVSSATATREIQIWFAGTSIFDTGTLTLSLSSAWTCYVTLIRVSASIIRYMISMTTEGAALAAYTAVGELTGLTLSGTNILKITGQANGVGAAASDVLAKMGSVSWAAAA